MTMNTILADFIHTHNRSALSHTILHRSIPMLWPSHTQMIIQCPSSYKQSIFQSYDEPLDQMSPTTSQSPPPPLQWSCKFSVDLADRLQLHIKHQGRIGRYVSHFHVSISVWNKNLNSILYMYVLSISTSKSIFFPNHFYSFKFSLLNTTHICKLY